MRGDNKNKTAPFATGFSRAIDAKLNTPFVLGNIYRSENFPLTSWETGSRISTLITAKISAAMADSRARINDVATSDDATLAVGPESPTRSHPRSCSLKRYI